MCGQRLQVSETGFRTQAPGFRLQASGLRLHASETGFGPQDSGSRLRASEMCIWLRQVARGRRDRATARVPPEASAGGSPATPLRSSERANHQNFWNEELGRVDNLATGVSPPDWGLLRPSLRPESFTIHYSLFSAFPIQSSPSQKTNRECRE